jgi:hypothetical protein
LTRRVLDSGEVSRVRDDPEAAPAGLGHVLNGTVNSGSAAGQHRDVVAVLGKLTDDRPPDTGAAARHHSDSSLRHQLILVSVRRHVVTIRTLPT